MWQLIDRLEWLYLLMNALCEDALETWRDSLAFPEMWTRTPLEESRSYDEGGEPMDLRYELDCQQENVDVMRSVTFPGWKGGAAHDAEGAVGDGRRCPNLTSWNVL